LKRKRRRLLLKLVNFWPPYLGAGVRVTRIAEDLRSFEVRMKLRWYNRNYVGTHYGGSLYSMCDPFFMLILLEGLGSGYEVWDKAASIRFRRPGRGTVTARFHVSDDEIEAIRREADANGKTEPRFTAELLDEAGEVVAEVEKLLHVRRRRETGQLPEIRHE
jgi:acyl-coenzyme A thioesterase PaaI-like protein